MTQQTMLPDLDRFIGTEQWYTLDDSHSFLFTDGVMHVVQTLRSMWLVHTIRDAQKLPELARQRFQSWFLSVTDKEAHLVATDGNDNFLWEIRRSGDGMPAGKLHLFFEGDTLLLPSEH